MDIWFSQFAKVAAVFLGAALLCYGTATALVLRYEARLAADPTLADGEPTLVMGAEVSDEPRLTRVDAFVGTLKAEVKTLPWERALVRNAYGPPTLFFAVNSVGEAFILCAKLAAVPPGCAPVVASSSELRQMSGAAVTDKVLTRIGVEPYIPPPYPAKVAMAYDAPTARTF
ncbi:MAG TPA: hypothetical protein VGT78_03700 [Rhizomicrobium sp.]|nr:hypothetical protein [Rhizomicrobium sp.]